MDTVALARVLLPQLKRFKLDTVAKALNVSLENHHRAVDDAEATAAYFHGIYRTAGKAGGHDDLGQVNALGARCRVDMVRKTANLSCDHSGEK